MRQTVTPEILSGAISLCWFQRACDMVIWNVTDVVSF